MTYKLSHVTKRATRVRSSVRAHANYCTAAQAFMIHDVGVAGIYMQLRTWLIMCMEDHLHHDRSVLNLCMQEVHSRDWHAM